MSSLLLLALGCQPLPEGVSEDPAMEDAGEAPDADADPSSDAGSDSDAAMQQMVDAGSSDAAKPVPPDPCSGKPIVCPTTTAAEGKGLVAIDRCAFPIEPTGAFSTAPALIAALEKITTKVSVATVLGDLNRDATSTTTVPGGPAGVSFGIRWQSDDDTTTTWIPQGISGSADASDTGLIAGKRVLLSDWYDDPPAGTPQKGVRVAFIDTATTRYRFALLVVPTGSAAAPNYAPLNLHGGGIAWYHDLLYVVDTGGGFRVFDMSRILQVKTDLDEFGCAAGVCRANQYKYFIPQIGAYAPKNSCGMRFSFLSLDRGTNPPSLVSGEYCTTGTCATPLAGRVYRWPIDAATGLLPMQRSWPKDAHLMGQRQVQGAATKGGVYYLSSSAPTGAGGALYRVKLGKSATSTWNTGPESVMIDLKNNQLISQSEYSPRVVFAVGLGSYPSP